MDFKLPEVKSIYDEDTKLKKEEIEALSEWVKNQPHLPHLEEFQVIVFLHSCYYNLEHAKQTIESYFTMKTKSDLFQNVDQELVKKTLTSFFIAFLPVKTPEGDTILLTKMIDTRPEVYNCVAHTKIFLLILTLHVHQYGPINGLIVVFDMEGTAFGHIIKINLAAVRLLTHFVQEAAPVRLKSIQHINSFAITGRLIALVRPFMKKEVYDMIKFHTDFLEPFYEYVPKKCLPEDYGGRLPSIKTLQEKNLENIVSNWNFLEWHNKQQIDENKKIQKSRGFFDMFRST